MVTINNSQVTAKSGAVNDRFSYEFMGLSTDDKPTDCGINSLFLELDTSDVYYFDGENWAKVGA